MEKISGIIPASPRVTAVDHGESHATRPGAPEFGVQKGVSSLGQKDRFSRSSVANKISDTFMNSAWKKRDLAKAGLVEKMTDRFFQSRGGSGPSEVYIVALPVVEGGGDNQRSTGTISFSETPTSSAGYADSSVEPVQEKASFLNVKG